MNAPIQSARRPRGTRQPTISTTAATPAATASSRNSVDWLMPPPRGAP